MALDTEQILQRLYPQLAKRKRRYARALATVAWVKKNGWPLGVGLVMLVGWVMAHLYFYNKLVNLEYNIQEAWAQVEAQWQRRYDIQQNLARTTLAYAEHERTLHLQLTQIRMAQQGAAPAKAAGPRSPAPLDLPEGKALEQLGPKELNAVFPRIQLMAEQYPNLRLSENFQQLSKATIEVETQATQQIMEYNKRVNAFTTLLKQFPGNIFGPICGFKVSDYDFYRPDRGTLPFRTIETKRTTEGER